MSKADYDKGYEDGIVFILDSIEHRENLTEGFFSILSSIIKSIFGTSDSDRIKRYVKKCLKGRDKENIVKIMNTIDELMKEFKEVQKIEDDKSREIDSIKKNYLNDRISENDSNDIRHLVELFAYYEKLGIHFQKMYQLLEPLKKFKKIID